MADRRPTVFIGSSREGLPIAEALQENLDDTCETVIWSQGIFGLGQGTLEALVDELPTFDFAILALTADDLTEARGEAKPSPRDNVLLEFGLSVGMLGRDRTFAVYDRTANIRLPSDLAGVTLATYQSHRSGNLQASLGSSCTKIKKSVRKLGLRTTEVPNAGNSVFLAVPMNAFKVAGKPGAYATFRTGILALLKALRTRCGMTDVFCAAENIASVEDFELPGASLAIDLEKLRGSSYFVLLWMKDVTSKSVLVETGMALAMGKPCILCLERGAELPFILRDASAALGNVKTVEFDTLARLAAHLSKNRRWIFPCPGQEEPGSPAK